MVICLERGADLHMAQLMPLPLTVSCFSKVQIGFTFLVLAHLGSPRQRAVKRVCVCVCVCVCDRRCGCGPGDSGCAECGLCRYCADEAAADDSATQRSESLASDCLCCLE